MSLRSRVPRTPLALPAILLLAATCGFDQQAAAAEIAAIETAKAPTTPWTTVAASGLVEARNTTTVEPAWRDVTRGDELDSAMVVRTGRRGRVTLTRHASLLILDPKSEVELPELSRNGLESSVVQNSGSVLYEVDGREEPHFEVITPYLVASVKGTEFLVTVNERYTSVTVREGLVEVTNPDTGEVSAVGAGDSLIRERDRIESDLIRDEKRRDHRHARAEAKRLTRLDRHARNEKQLEPIEREPGEERSADAFIDLPYWTTGAHRSMHAKYDRDEADPRTTNDEISQDTAHESGSSHQVADPPNHDHQYDGDPRDDLGQPPGDDGSTVNQELGERP